MLAFCVLCFLNSKLQLETNALLRGACTFYTLLFRLLKNKLPVIIDDCQHIKKDLYYCSGDVLDVRLAFGTVDNNIHCAT